MSENLQRVFIAGTGSYLPHAPIPNERIDDILGRVDDAPPRVQGFLKNVGPKMLEGSGIETRHFSIDPETHKLTHTVASLGEHAARRALDHAGRQATDVELLILAAPNYDRSTPPTSVLLQQRLGIQTCAEMEIHSNCSGVGKSVQVAYDALRLGRFKTALVVIPQLSSVYLRSSYFKQDQMNKTQAALRYILADGSGALLLQAAEPGFKGPLTREIIGTYIESIGGNMPPAMTAGGGVEDLVEPRSPSEESWALGRHHLDQDFAAVNRHAGPFLLEGTLRMLSHLGIDPHAVNHFVFSIPTMQLYEGNFPSFVDRLFVTPETMKFRARNTGYCGGASVLLHFDEMVRSGEIKTGQLVVLDSVESSKWMTAGFVIRG